ncbi:hypothetical protein P7C73_g3884, partial [Tremellales sp. Uapishka_1]
MGSSHSQPSQPRRSPTPPSPPSSSTSQIAPPPVQPSRLSHLRRLSSFARPGESPKRERPGSTASRRKKRKVDDLSSTHAGESRLTRNDSSSPSTLSSTDSIAQQSSHPTTSEILTPGDPLLPDRLRSISSIREALGPEWPLPTTVAPAVDRLFNRFRRPSALTAEPETLPPPPVSQSLTRRVSTILGLSGTSELPSDPSLFTPPPPLVPPQSTLAESIIDLQNQLSAAQAEVAASDRELAATRARVEEARAQAQAQTRIPAGAVLVIQGLAQTQTQPDEPVAVSSVPPRSRRRSENLDHANIRPDQHRRANSLDSMPGSYSARASRSRSGSSPTPPPDGIPVPSSLEVQARMIGGLLTVAAAATATTLLTTESPARNSNRSALASIMSRIRPFRTRSPRSVEAALGDYLRTVLRDNERLDASRSIAAQATAESTTSDETAGDFQAFLERLQSDLVDAVRDFAGPAGDVPTLGDVSDPIEEQTTVGDVVSLAREPSRPGPATELEANEDADANTTLTSPAVPSFHHQAGQILPSDRARSTGVSGGTDGTPRRLNFFRAHLFPTTSHQREDGLVPSIFVGVRSISHDPNVTTEELVQHPSFPFLDGNVPTLTSTEGEAQPPTAQPERRTLRDRMLERFSPRPRPLVGPLNTYLVYVIGGNYPPSHPILRIPNLISGGPLTDEEMHMVTELMGPVKPPTASKEDIEKSGLRLVSGREMGGLGTLAEVLENCTERCLICLGDYEAEDQCRILNCRHAFHKDCVDQWLSQGRNSCPACRSEAVDKAKPLSVAGEAELSLPDGVVG